ncbi:MAG: YfiR family protein [Flavitalea sp.]
MKKLIKNIWICRYRIAIWLLFSQSSVLAQSTPELEYQLKAVFLFNFTQFTEWPADSFHSDSEPLVIGIVGENPFGAYLESIVSGEMKGGHPVVVKYYKDEEDAGTCHVLFFHIKDPQRRKEIIEGATDKNILTVSDDAAFLKEGGMVRFFTSSNKIKFQISLNACKKARLELSSKLLRVADIIEPPEIK